MTISRITWNKYITMLRDVNDKAAGEVQAYYLNHYYNIANPTSEDTKALIDYCYAIVNKYGEASASLSAEMYDVIAMLEGVSVPAAELAEIASYGDVAKSVNGTLLVSNNPELISNAVGRWVKMAGADTTLKNALRDGAQFAWVPSGDTCAFCLTLASRGWQYASKKAIKGGHAEHIHSNCDCQYCISFNGKTSVTGYDPDAYYEMYRSAEGRTPEEKINSMRRNAYEKDKKTEGSDNSELINVN